MAQKIEMYKTRDGKVYYNKHAADRHDRGIMLGNKINSLPGDKKTKDYIKDNWKQIRELVETASGAIPNEVVPDKDIPKSMRVKRPYKKRKK